MGGAESWRYRSAMIERWDFHALNTSSSTSTTAETANTPWPRVAGGSEMPAAATGAAVGLIFTANIAV